MLTQKGKGVSKLHLSFGMPEENVRDVNRLSGYAVLQLMNKMKDELAAEVQNMFVWIHQPILNCSHCKHRPSSRHSLGPHVCNISTRSL